MRVMDADLGELAASAWDVFLEAEPLYATAIGDHRFDDRLPPAGRADRSAVIARLEAFRGQAATLAATTWPDIDDAVTASALDAWLGQELDRRRASLADWVVDPLDGPQVAFLDVASYQHVESPADGRAMATRWAAMGPWVDAHTADLRASSAEGRVSPTSPIRRVLDQLDDLLGRPDVDWPLLAPARVERPGWSETDRLRFTDALARAVGEAVRPALERYRTFLADELVPGARSDDRPGLLHVPDGVEAYAGLARAHTSLEVTPEAIHRIGLDEVARVDAELGDLAGRVLGSVDRRAAIARFRSDPALHFTTEAEVLETARRSLERAAAALGAWFGRLPRAGCEVVAMERHEAEHSTIAYYRDPAADGSRPGRYYINLAKPATRPRYEAEALAFHESVPGHHLQVAIAQELTWLPAFRRFGGTTAYVEGWGLYAERLADEMELYSADIDRIGVLSFDGWRSCRLVVDTGLHALGWTRQEAIDHMTEHTALAPNNIANEVDRYISGPGQALAYKLGQRELLRLRAEARATLGQDFDIRRFHDVVLESGALPLGTLAEVVGRWVAATTSAAGRPASDGRALDRL
jgi:uncharacterized protein (DUF885 family)